MLVNLGWYQWRYEYNQCVMPQLMRKTKKEERRKVSFSRLLIPFSFHFIRYSLFSSLKNYALSHKNKLFYLYSNPPLTCDWSCANLQLLIYPQVGNSTNWLRSFRSNLYACSYLTQYSFIYRNELWSSVKLILAEHPALHESNSYDSIQLNKYIRSYSKTIEKKTSGSWIHVGVGGNFNPYIF